MPTFRGEPFGPIVAFLALGLLGVVGGCRERLAPPLRDSSEVSSWASRDRFGEGVDPERVVASVNGRDFTAGDVAVCQLAQPMLSPRQCLETLIDTQLAELEANDDDRQDPRVGDARIAGLASAYLRDVVDRPLGDETIADEEIDAFLRDPVNRLYVEAPELRQCSHLLVRPGDGGIEAARALAARIASSTDWATVIAADDLDRLRESWSETASNIGLRLVIDEHLLVHDENEDPQAWPLLTPVVPEFSAALFALGDPPAVSPPVETSFGVHFILLERVFPATRLSDEEARGLARSELGQRRRVEALQRMLEALRQEREVFRSAAIEIFRAGDEELIQERSSEIRESLRPE